MLCAIARRRSSPARPFSTRLREAGCDDAGGARAGRDALLHGRLDMLLRQNDVDEVDLFRHFGERRIGLASP